MNKRNRILKIVITLTITNLLFSRNLTNKKIRVIEKKIIYVGLAKDIKNKNNTIKQNKYLKEELDNLLSSKKLKIRTAKRQ